MTASQMQHPKDDVSMNGQIGLPKKLVCGVCGAAMVISTGTSARHYICG